MYPYHNLNKKRIKNGELVGFEITQDYRNTGECLLLYFKTPPFIRPVRPARYAEYIKILEAWKKSSNANNFLTTAVCGDKITLLKRDDKGK